MTTTSCQYPWRCSFHRGCTLWGLPFWACTFQGCTFQRGYTRHTHPLPQRDLELGIITSRRELEPSIPGPRRDLYQAYPHSSVDRQTPGNPSSVSLFSHFTMVFSTIFQSNKCKRKTLVQIGVILIHEVKTDSEMQQQVVGYEKEVHHRRNLFTHYVI